MGIVLLNEQNMMCLSREDERCVKVVRAASFVMLYIERSFPSILCASSLSHMGIEGLLGNYFKQKGDKSFMLYAVNRFLVWNVAYGL